jgi:hypothetical protein
VNRVALQPVGGLAGQTGTTAEERREAEHDAPSPHGPHRGRPAGWQGPAQRSPARRAVPRTRTTSRRRAASADTLEENELPEAPDEESISTRAVGAMAQADGERQDERGEDGGDGSRQDRILRSRAFFDVEAAPGDADGSAPAPHEIQAHVERYVDQAAALAVRAQQPGGVADAAGTVRVAAALRRLMLDLLLSTEGAGRLDAGGLARAREHLLQVVAPRVSAGPRPAGPAARMNALLPLLMLQLQKPRTKEQAEIAIARLMVLGNPGTRP